MKAVPNCLQFDRHPVARALSRAWAKTGKRIAAKIAMIAITTSSSMSVNPLRRSMKGSSFKDDLAAVLSSGRRATKRSAAGFKRTCSPGKRSYPAPRGRDSEHGGRQGLVGLDREREAGRGAAGCAPCAHGRSKPRPYDRRKGWQAGKPAPLVG